MKDHIKKMHCYFALICNSFGLNIDLIGIFNFLDVLVWLRHCRGNGEECNLMVLVYLIHFNSVMKTAALML